MLAHFSDKISVDIDDPEDFERAERLMKMKVLAEGIKC